MGAGADRIVGWVACALVAAPLSAWAGEAEEWARAWKAESLDSLAPAPVTRLLVVAAGTSAEEARPSALALRQVLKERPSAPAVLGSESLGVVDGLDDAAIVVKCAGLPVDRVVVVRVEPPGTVDDSPSATAVAYGPDGVRQASLLVRSRVRGRSLSEAEIGTLYWSRSLHVFYVATIERSTSVHLQRWVEYRLGKQPLDRPAFFALLGREDLARLAQAAQAAAWMRRAFVLLPIVGGLVGAGGVVLLGPLGVPMLTAFAPLLAGFGVAWAVAQSPVAPDGLPSMEEERDLTDDYNRRVLAELGVAGDPPVPDEQRLEWMRK